MTDQWPQTQPPYFERVGIEFDTAINVLTGGPLGWTVSQRAAWEAGWRPSADPARAQRTGARKPGWCLFCRFLGVVVQRDHCALQFTDRPSSVPTYASAGLAFGAGALFLGALGELIARHLPDAGLGLLSAVAALGVARIINARASRERPSRHGANDAG